MKSHIFKFAATLLITLVSALVLSAPSTADACSPPQEGTFVYDGIAFEQAVPLNGAWAFRASVHNASLDDISVEVRDENDALVAGNVSNLLIRDYSSDWIQQSSDNLVVWTPPNPCCPSIFIMSRYAR